MTNDEKNTILERINKNDLNINNDVSLFIKSSTTNWIEPEWGFPKGRRNYQEKDLACALREFEEETGCSKNSLKLIQNVLPIEELFTGSNYKSYKHLYYLATLKTFSTETPQFQKSEVSNIEWLTFAEANKKIRPYNYEKKEILKRVNILLNNYTIYA